MVTQESMVGWAGALALAAMTIACGDPQPADAAPSGNTAGSAGHGGAGGMPPGAGGDGGAPAPCNEAAGHFITEVVTVSYGSGQSFGRDQMPDIVLGPPRGAGCCQGSLDVVSLGNGGVIEVGFGDARIVDGAGVDFVVFENAFEAGQGVFAELATVEVSDDGVRWSAFPCSATTPPFDACAGQQPVYLDGDDGPVDPSTSGGDGFDLADVGMATARYVRISDRPDLDGFDGVFDLDAVGIVNASCAP